ncbi:MAG: hypothetical protein ABW217_08805, partial [Polyangiaceae bacterium]
MLHPARGSSSSAALALLLAVLPVAAEPASPAPEVPAATPPALTDAPAAASESEVPLSARAPSSPAHELFLDAERRYDARDYEGALRSLRHSYELATPELRIGLLFSLA